MEIINNRGAVHTLEAFLAAIIIFTTLLYSNPISYRRDDRTEKSIESVGMEALLSLDCEGALGRLVEARQWNTIEDCLRSVLPSGISFNMTVISEGGATLNDRAISNGGLVGRTVVSIEYALVGESVNCPFYKIRLQLGE
jgi:hypothetical protein